MSVLNRVLLALLCNFSIAGCSSVAPDSANAEGQIGPVDSQKTPARVIVVFKEGITRDEALEAAAGYGLKAALYYKGLSEHSNKVHLLLQSASLSAEGTVQLLKNDPRVESASIDCQRRPLKAE